MANNNALQEGNISRVISFLCNTDAVVTSSYHGAHWAMLSGKRVVVVGSGIPADQ